MTARPDLRAHPVIENPADYLVGYLRVRAEYDPGMPLTDALRLADASLAAHVAER